LRRIGKFGGHFAAAVRRPFNDFVDHLIVSSF
jgi:hypothetical protein